MLKEIKSKNKGAAMIIFVLFLLLSSLTIIVGIVTPVVREFQIAVDSYDSKQTYFLAESGVEDAFYRLKSGKQLGSSETLVLGSTQATTSITDVGSAQKEISSLGDTNSGERRVKLVTTTGVGASFNYGLQTGTGGITMNNSSTVNGNVYSNGNITGTSSNVIAGSAIAANQSSNTVNQQNGDSSPTNDITFGSASASQDFGQSFVPSTTDTVTQVSVYIKKVGSPSNLTVRITSNSSGKPATSSLGTGTLSASNVTTSYGWVNIMISSPPTLSSGTTYWVVLDGSNNSSNYYRIGGDSGYASGAGSLGKYGSTSWGATSPSGLDGYFKIYLGGVMSTISGVTVGSAGVGNAMAHTVNNSTVAGSLYCQTGSGNNKSCDTSQADPSPQNFPISDSQITEWKDIADDGGTSSGISLSGSSTQTIGPKKISGSVTLSNNAILTVSGTLWVTGNLTLNNTSKITLASSFGSMSGMIIVDGTVSTNNSAQFYGSGTTGSYIMVITTSTSSSAISLNNSVGTVILVAPNGGATVNNSATVKELVAKTVTLNNSASISYESGLANVQFSTGPSGSWTISSWKESQ